MAAVTSGSTTLGESLAGWFNFPPPEERLIFDVVAAIDKESHKQSGQERRRWIDGIRGESRDIVNRLDHLRRQGTSQEDLQKIAEQFVQKLREEAKKFYDPSHVDSAMHAIDQKIASLAPGPSTFPPYKELERCLEQHPRFIGEHPQESYAIKSVAKDFAGTKQFGDEIDGRVDKVLKKRGLDSSKDPEGTGATRLLSYRLVDALDRCKVKEGEAPATSEDDSLFNEIVGRIIPIENN